jgi:hypothetical protein
MCGVRSQQIRRAASVTVFHASAAATTAARTTATTAALSRLGESLQSLRERALAGEGFERFDPGLTPPTDTPPKT